MTKESRPLVTIVVPIYNISQYFDECVQSIASQTYENIEVFLVTGKSPDNSIELAKEFSKKDKRFRYLSSEDSSVSGNRNTGLGQATGEYVMFVDGDDFIAQDAVENLVNTVEQSQSDIAFGLFEQRKEYLEHGDVFDNRLDPRVFEQGCRDKILRHIAKRSLSPCVWRNLYKKSLLVENNLIFPKNVSMAEDLYFTVRAVTMAKKVGYYDGTVIFYRIREGSAVHSLLTVSKVVAALGVAVDTLEYYKTRTNKAEKKYIISHIFKLVYEWLALSKDLPKDEKAKLKVFIRDNKKQIRSILWKHKMIGMWTRIFGIIPGCASAFFMTRVLDKLFNRKGRFKYLPDTQNKDKITSDERE